MERKQIPVALTIAGSDPSGGAGVQADLKVFSALNVYGMTALTCLTAGNTTGVQAVEFIKPDFVEHQIECVIDDIPPRAVKTGMLGNSEIVRATSSQLASLSIPIIVDPVMKTKRGDVLLAKEDIQLFIEEILPLAHLITPNIPEANLLSGMVIKKEVDMKKAAQIIYEKGSDAVLIKAGYFDEWSYSNDLFFDGESFTWIKAERVRTSENHGAGDVLSAAITAYTALDLPLLKAVQQAKSLVSKALNSAPGLGKGGGPLNLFGTAPTT